MEGILIHKLSSSPPQKILRHQPVMKIDETTLLDLQEFKRKHKLKSVGKAVKYLLIFYSENKNKKELK